MRPLPLVLFIACQKPMVAPTDSGGETETGVPDTDSPIIETDEDGDGFPPWTDTTDPARADCDDQDPNVNPNTERYVPAGSFWRGDDLFPETSPMTQITMSDYCIDRLEVTNTEFVELLETQENNGTPNMTNEGLMLYDFMDDDDNIPERIEMGSSGGYNITAGYEHHPVVEVFHWAAVFYCEQRGLHLPTEAQWEKAARGPDDPHLWPWGQEEPSCDTANIMLITGKAETELCVGDTTAVEDYPDGASPYGALNMSGNVAEWVADWYQAAYYTDSPTTDPEGPETGEAEFDGVLQPARMTRGGAYATESGQATVIYRYPERQDGSSNGVGFRCAREL